jgi:hypothetical protein
MKGVHVDPAAGARSGRLRVGRWTTPHMLSAWRFMAVPYGFISTTGSGMLWETWRGPNSYETLILARRR